MASSALAFASAGAGLRRREALRKMTISVAFPTVSLAYVLIAVIDHFVFKESLGVAQIGGLLLIIAGVTLLNVSA